MGGLIGNFQLGVTAIISIVLLLATLIALVDAITRGADVFEAAGKLTKGGWTLILGISLGMELLFGMIGVFVGAIATIVYFVDVRPAVAAYGRRR